MSEDVELMLLADCEQCKSFYLELERLTQERDEARANYAFMVERTRKAAQSLISEVGAEGPMNVDDAAKAAVKALRAAKKRELEALAELDEARAGAKEKTGSL